MSQPFNLYHQEHLYRFRMAAAGIIRDILSAVEQSDRRVLTEAIRHVWWDKNHRPSEESVESLLKNAEKNLRVFPGKFAGSLDSIPYPRDADGEPAEESVEVRVEKLRDLIYDFADPEALKQARDRLKKNMSVNWANLCQWELLPDIRTLLDSFPEEVGQSSVVKIDDLMVEDPDTVRYRGVECTKLTKKCFLILKHLLTCRNHTTSIGTLREVVWRKDDDEWGPVDSALRDVRRFFDQNNIPYDITRRRETKQIWLKKIQPLGKAKTQARKSLGGSKNQRSKGIQSSAKKRVSRK